MRGSGFEGLKFVESKHMAISLQLISNIIVSIKR